MFTQPLAFIFRQIKFICTVINLLKAIKTVRMPNQRIITFTLRIKSYSSFAWNNTFIP